MPTHELARSTSRATSSRPGADPARDTSGQQARLIKRDTLEVVSGFGHAGRWAGQFYGAHNIAADPQGNLFVTETYEGKRVQKFVYTGMGPASPPILQD